MRYKIIIEAIVDFGDNDIEAFPSELQPRGIAEQLANMAIASANIAADEANVISVEPIKNE
jgi:hypothetical protein